MEKKTKSDSAPPLLYSRRQLAQRLGPVDVSFVRRLEKAGRLKGIRLTRSPSAMVFFRAEDIDRLIREADDAMPNQM